MTSYPWGMDGNGGQSYVTVNNNTGTYGYQGSTNVIGIAAAGSTTYNGGDDLARVAVSAVGHATPYVNRRKRRVSATLFVLFKLFVI